CRSGLGGSSARAGCRGSSERVGAEWNRPDCQRDHSDGSLSDGPVGLRHRHRHHDCAWSLPADHAEANGRWPATYTYSDTATWLHTNIYTATYATAWLHAHDGTL